MRRKLLQLHVLRAAVLIGGLALPIGCAAVTGLSDYEIVGLTDASTTETGALSDGAAPPPIDGTMPDVTTTSPADASDDALVTPPPYVPSCGRADCTGLTGICTFDKCAGGTELWTKDEDLEVIPGRCRARGKNNVRAFLYTSAATPNRYQFELTFDITELQQPAAGGVLARVQAGTGLLELVFESTTQLKLCTANAECSAAFDFVDHGGVPATHIDVHGSWTVGSGGMATVETGATTCTQGATLALNAASVGDVTVGVGCDGTKVTASPMDCQLEFANATFSVTPY